MNKSLIKEKWQEETINKMVDNIKSITCIIHHQHIHQQIFSTS